MTEVALGVVFGVLAVVVIELRARRRRRVADPVLYVGLRGFHE